MDTVTLHWSGVDDVHGSGIKDYAFYYSENNGPFVLYQKNISDTTIQFVGTPGKTYCFYTIAADNTNNKENFKSSCDGSAFLPISGAALPITWLYFNGRDIGKDALLNWATTSEINSKFFGVERSVDGINFTSIGNVTAAGNSSITTNYNFVDSNAMNLPASELYYRLKQVDIDGRSTYSIIITIKIYHNNIEPQITAYPNPFTQNITLRVMAVSATDQTDNVTLYNVDGKMLYKKKVVQRGNATILLEDIPTLNRGIYLLTVSINKKQYTIKMVRK